MLHDEIRDLEGQLTTAAVRASVEDLDRIISDEFVEFGSSGRVYTKRDVVAQMLAKPEINVTISDFRVLAISSHVVLATYRTGRSLRSSVWRHEEEQWRIVFHQGTPITVDG